MTSKGKPAAAHSAATVMLLRESTGHLQVLLQRRAATLWYGGNWVFPGGSVDAADGDLELDLANVVRRAAALPEGQAVAGDARETVESEWFEPEAALEHAASGRLALMPPTRMSLLDLQLTHALHGSLLAMLYAEQARPIVPILPRLVGPTEARVAVYPWDPDYSSLPGDGIGLAGEAPAYLRRLPSRLVLGGSGEPVRPVPERARR